MDFKTYGSNSGNNVSAVQVKLTNGKKSPLFLNEDFDHYNDERIIFKADDAKIRKIAAYDGSNFVHTIKFLGGSG